MTKRIQKKRTKGWKMPPNTVYVGRPTKWGNPFRVGEEAWRFSTNVPYPFSKTIEEVVENYRYYANLHILFHGREWIRPLWGKDLACWCPLDQPCHADVLLEILGEYRK